MQPKHKAQAGTFESGDMMVLIEPKEQDGANVIELSSNVSKQFGPQIEALISKVLEQYNLTGAHVIVKDKGALNPTIEARVETAVKRSLDLQKGTL
ncbi:MAG: citrate lyase acyl carrier protein [Salinivirgaceae bacterium]|jgi:citrate lyase subunit gamma (acyl carrier protein)|nr:citrate lyase acyl carrier protein [Salinivirgaceae bacterium]